MLKDIYYLYTDGYVHIRRAVSLSILGNPETGKCVSLACAHRINVLEDAFDSVSAL